jgi:hypothetical protein
MRIHLVSICGLLAVIAGLIWMAQGSGYFPYPAESFMINQKPWIFRGGVLACVGIVAIVGEFFWRRGR